MPDPAAQSSPAHPADLTQPPAPPRQITAQAGRRSWLEPRVRIWWASAFLLLLVAGSYTAERVYSLRGERWLLAHGRKIENAVIDEIDGVTRKGYVPVADHRPRVRIRYVDANGVENKLIGELDYQREGARVGNTITVLVDPRDPRRWTDRLSVSWFDELMINMLLGPFILILSAIALIQRRSVLRIWQNEPLREALVVDTRHSGFFPFSRVVRMTVDGDRSQRVVWGVVPRDQANFHPGDMLYVVSPPRRPHQALIAFLYH
jgi:hypothetical protein